MDPEALKTLNKRGNNTMEYCLYISMGSLSSPRALQFGKELTANCNSSKVIRESKFILLGMRKTWDHNIIQTLCQV